MAVSDISPVSGSVVLRGDSFSFKLDAGATPDMAQVTVDGDFLEVAWDLATGFQPGFSGTATLVGTEYTIIIARVGGFEGSPFTVTVDWVVGVVSSQESWSYVLQNEECYPELMQPRNPESIGCGEMHGDLDGLDQDDHTQYHNDTRGDVRYPRRLEGAGPPGVSTGDGLGLGTVYVDTTANLSYTLVDATAGANVWSSGVADHGALTGLGDDDHPQYATVGGARDAVLEADYSPAFGVLVQQSGTGTPQMVSIGTNQVLGRLSGGGTLIQGLGTASLSPLVDHGQVAGLGDDDHAQYLLLAGRAGGQSAFGGTAAADNLTLEANTAAGVAAGRIIMNSAVEFNSISATGAPYAFNYDATESYAGSFVGGGLNMSGNVTFSNPTFIYESFRGAPTITTAANPGFAAYTVLQALPTLNAGSGAGHNPLSPLILNAGPRVANSFSGTRTTGAITGVNFAPTVAGGVSGAVMNITNVIGLTVGPTWDTVSGSTINFGTITGVKILSPAVNLFGSSAGTERAQAIYGLDMDNPSGINNGFGSMPVACIRSGVSAGTNRFFLLNAGSAGSVFGAGHIYFDDGRGVAYGGTGINFDFWSSWNAGGYFRQYFNSGFADDLRWSNPANGRFLFDNNGGNTSGEYNFNCAKFSLGAQTGSNGNQVGSFTAGIRSTVLAGEWSDFLLTQAANITVDHAMGGVFGWTVNAPSIVLGTGTVTTAGVLNVGGNVGQGSVNRFGVRILSNPSGGSGINAALWVTAGRSRFDGFVDINKPIALGGGAAATLGNIGGAGPTAAAQAQWVQIEVNGVNHWIAAWT